MFFLYLNDTWDDEIWAAFENAKKIYSWWLQMSWLGKEHGIGPASFSTAPWVESSLLESTLGDVESDKATENRANQKCLRWFTGFGSNSLHFKTMYSDLREKVLGKYTALSNASKETSSI